MSEKKYENQIQKSRPLQAIQQCHLPLMAYKVLDTYLSKINMHDPSKTEIIITKSELESIWGTPKIHINALKKTLKILMQVVEFNYENEDLLFTLFDCAKIESDEYGAKRVKLICGNTAKQYIFNVDNIGYLRYSLSEVVGFSSKYSYLLYIYLKNGVKQYRGQKWVVGIDEIKVLLDCFDENTGAYTDTKYFMKILNRAQEDIDEKRNFKFTYKPIKANKVICGIEFCVEGEPAKAAIAERKQEESYEDYVRRQKEYDKRLATDKKFREKERRKGKHLKEYGESIQQRVEYAEKKNSSQNSNKLSDEK